MLPMSKPATAALPKKGAIKKITGKRDEVSVVPHPTTKPPPRENFSVNAVGRYHLANYCYCNKGTQDEANKVVFHVNCTLPKGSWQVCMVKDGLSVM